MINQLALKVDFEKVILVEGASVVMLHLRTHASSPRTHVGLEGIQRVGERVHGVDHELHFRILLVSPKVTQSEKETSCVFTS